MTMQPPVVGGIFHLNVARDLTWQVQPIDRTKDMVKERVTDRHVAAELEKLIAMGPRNCGAGHLP